MTTFLNRFSNTDARRIQISSTFVGTPTFHDGLAYDESGPDLLVVNYAGTPEYYQAGIGFTAAGEMCVFDASAGLPADTMWQSGLPISRAQHRLCVDPTNAVDYVHQGVPFTTVHAVAVDGSATPSGCDSPTEILTQTLSGSGTGFVSQYDTSGAGTDLAKVYQDFVFADGAIVTDFHWSGGLADPPAEPSVTSWLVQFWTNNAGIPGTLIQAQTFTPLAANPVLIGHLGSITVYEHSVDFMPWFYADPGVTYWVSVQASCVNPPLWNWCVSSVGSAYQVIVGSGAAIAFNLAMDLTGCIGSEPAGDFYEQEGNTDIYIQETADAYIQE